MKIVVTDELLGYDGTPLTFTESIDDEGKPVIKNMTVRAAITVALNYREQNKLVTEEEASKVYQISSKLYPKKEVDLTVSEMAFIKAKAVNPLSYVAYGRLSDIFEGKKETHEQV